MKAAMLYETGGPEVFKVEEAPMPKPSPTQVLMKVAGCGMCGHDQADHLGLTHVEKPVILGHEASGVVVEVGSMVRDFKPGDRVATRQSSSCGRCVYCRSGRDTLCSTRRKGTRGGFAEYMVAEDECLAEVPENVDLAGASIVACAVGTCWRALKTIGKIRRDETVAVTGAGGGLGIHGVQVAKALGAKVIAITSSPDKVEEIKQYGADHVVLAQGDYEKELKRLTDGKGLDVVLDNVGAPTFPACYRSLARYGRYVFTGQLSRQKVEIYPFFIFTNEAIITGSATTRQAEFLESMELVAQGKVKPVYQAYPLTKVVKAFQDMGDRKIFGRGVLVPDGA